MLDVLNGADACDADTLKTILNSAPQGYLFFRAGNKELVFCNLKAQQLFNFSPAGNSGKILTDLFTGSLENVIRTGLEVAAKAGNYQTTVQQEDSYTYLQLTFSAVFSATENKVANILVTCNERIAGPVANAPFTEEKKFNKLLINSHDGIALINSQAVIHYVTPAIQRILGYTQEELTGKDSFVLIHPDSEAEVRSALQRVSAGPGYSEDIVVRVKHKSGTWKYVKSTLTNFLEDEVVKAIVVNFIDETEKTLAKKQIEFERKNLDALINSITGLVWSVDRDLKLITANYAYLNLVKTITGRDIQPGVSLAEMQVFDMTRWRRFYEQALMGLAFTVDYYEPATATWAEISFSPLIMNKQVVGAACYATDITARKKAAEQLRRNEQLLSQAQQVAHFGCWQFELQKKNLFQNQVTWSDEVFRILGLDTEEAEPGIDVFLRMVHPDDKEKVLTAFRQSVKEFTNFSLEHRIIRGDGQIIWVNEYVAVIRDEMTKEPERLIGTVQDITEKKLAEDKLHFSFAQLQKALNVQTSILNSLPAHIALLDAEGNIVAVNKSWQQTFPFSSALVNENYIQFLDNRKTPEALAGKNGINRVLRGDQKEFTVEFECTISPEHSSYKLLANSLESSGAVIMYQNITEQLDAQQKLIKSEANLRAIFDSSVVSFIMCDVNLNIVAFNKQAVTRSRTYYNTDMKVGDNLVDLIAGRNDIVTSKALLQKVLDGEMVSFETQKVFVPGSSIWLSVTMKRIMAGNECIGLYIATSDITEEKEQQIEKERMTAELIRQNQNLHQFTYIVSHNLRAPLANILAFTEELQDEDHDADLKKRLMKELTASVQKLDGVIQDLNGILQISREVSQVRERVSIAEVVSDIQLYISAITKEKNVCIETDFSEVSELYSIRSFIHSIFYNLISNSIKYSSPGKQPHISISARKEDKSAVIVFADNGMGIDLTKYCDQVFGLYKRFHHHVEGKGLGLFMIKAQVEALGGSIRISSEPGKGTIFTITF